MSARSKVCGWENLGGTFGFLPTHLPLMKLPRGIQNYKGLQSKLKASLTLLFMVFITFCKKSIDKWNAGSSLSFDRLIKETFSNLNKISTIAPPIIGCQGYALLLPEVTLEDNEVRLVPWLEDDLRTDDTTLAVHDKNSQLAGLHSSSLSDLNLNLSVSSEASSQNTTLTSQSGSQNFR